MAPRSTTKRRAPRAKAVPEQAASAIETPPTWPDEPEAATCGRRTIPATAGMGQDQPNEIESGEKAVIGTLKGRIEHAETEGCFQKKEIILSFNFMNLHILRSLSNDYREIQDIFHSVIYTLKMIGYVVSERKQGFRGDGIDIVFTLAFPPHLDTLARLRIVRLTPAAVLIRADFNGLRRDQKLHLINPKPKSLKKCLTTFFDLGVIRYVV